MKTLVGRTSRGKPCGGVIAGLACGYLAIGALQARQPQQPLQEDRPSFRADVDLVVYPVSVLDSDDLPVEGLSLEDFVVVEDGAEQDIAVLLSPREAPLEVALLMDVSDSMRSMEEAARSSAIQFLDQLSADDCVFLLRFTATPGPGLWGSPRHPDIRAAVNETPMGGGTALRDTIAEGYRRLVRDLERCSPVLRRPGHSRGAQQRRPALVMVTDGMDDDSFMTFVELLSIARQADAPFLPVGFGDLPLLDRFHRRTFATRSLDELKGLARVTGGHFIKGGRSIERLNEAYGEVISWLRSYYLVGYYPALPDDALPESELPSWREVEVRVRRPGYQVHTREGHYRTPIDVVAADRHVQAGVRLIARGESVEALVELTLALQSNPYCWEAYYHRGAALLLQGELRAAQGALLRAAELHPGRGDVHQLACRVSLELDDTETAWDQAIRAHQAGADMSDELRTLRRETSEPANLEGRLRAPRIYIDPGKSLDPIEQAVRQRVALTLAQELSEAPEVGLVDAKTLADYRVLLKVNVLSVERPYELEADLEIRESAGDVENRGPDNPGVRYVSGKLLYQMQVSISDVEDNESMAAELARYVTEIRARVTG